MFGMDVIGRSRYPAETPIGRGSGDYYPGTKTQRAGAVAASPEIAQSLRLGREEQLSILRRHAADLLEAELGEPTESSDGRLVVTKLTIRVPKGSRPAAYIGPSRDNLGRISIETTPSNLPDLNVYVRFVVGS